MQLVTPLREEDPRQVGPFALAGRLGAGGFGVVYLGHDRLGRAAAVKVIMDAVGLGIDRREQHARFRRERDFLREFTHAGIPRLVNAGKQEGRDYLAIDFVAGPTLQKLVDSGCRLPDDAVLWLGRELAAILRDLHGYGIHRDIKPSNVLVTATTPYLIDFGQAQQHDALPITQFGVWIGTPAYGERQGGTPGDVLALGGALFFAATGRPPRPTPADGEPPYPLEQIDLSDLSPELQDVVGGCLNPTRAVRPDAAELIDQIERRLRAPSFEAALPTAARDMLAQFVPPRPHTRPPSRPPSRPSTQPLPPMPPTGPSTPSAGRPEGPSRPTPVRPDPRPMTGRTRGGARWQTRLGERVLAVVAPPGGRVLVVTGDGRVTALSEHDGSRAWQVRLPVAASGCVAVVAGRAHVGAGASLYVLDVGSGRQDGVLNVGGTVSSCAVAGRWIVAGTRGGALAAFDASTGRHAWDEELPTQLSGGLTAARETVFAGGADGVVYARAGAPGARLLTSRPLGQRIHVLTASSRGVHVGGTDGGLIGLDHRGVPTPRRTPPDDGQVWACAGEPEGNLVASASVDGVVRVDDVLTGRSLVAQSGSPVRRALALRQGLLATGHVDGSLIVRDARSGAQTATFDGPGAIEVPPAVTASRMIVAGWVDGTVAALQEGSISSRGARSSPDEGARR